MHAKVNNKKNKFFNDKNHEIVYNQRKKKRSFIEAFYNPEHIHLFCIKSLLLISYSLDKVILFETTISEPFG